VWGCEESREMGDFALLPKQAYCIVQGRFQRAVHFWKGDLRETFITPSQIKN